MNRKPLIPQPRPVTRVGSGAWLVILAYLAIMFVLMLLGGCGSVPVPAGVVKEAVWTPCPVDVPQRPVFPADDLTGAEDLFTLGARLWGDRRARQAYELELETRLTGCTKK